MVPDAIEVRLNRKDRAELGARVRGRKTAQRDVFRARIVLLAAEARSTRSIARELCTMPRTVSLWRGRYAREDLAGLEERPRSGPKPKYGKEAGERILAVLERPPPAGFGGWTAPLVAKELKDGHEQYVWRYLRARRIDLAGSKSWCESNDPDFREKAADVVGLYLAPPENAIVLCADEKPSIQALERAHGYHKLPNGRTLSGHSHDYKRNGTTTLFAALEVATGKVIAVHKRRRRRVEFLDFMNRIVSDYPDRELHVVLENLSTYKPRNDQWLKRHPNVHFHFTPTRASWLNQVEVWFSILEGQSLKNASSYPSPNFRSTSMPSSRFTTMKPSRSAGQKNASANAPSKIAVSVSCTRGVLAVVLLFAIRSAIAAEQSCKMEQLASVELGTDPAGGVYVPVNLDGHAVNLRIATGSAISTLSRSAVAKLSLNQDGRSRTHADTLGIGTETAKHVPFLILPDDRLPLEESGMIARDILSRYDVELDFAASRFNLFAPGECGSQVVYWTHDTPAKVPFHINELGQMATTVYLDSQPIEAVLDTGVWLSSMGFEEAKGLFGWNEPTAGLTIAGRRPDGSPGGYRFPFKTLFISGVSVTNPDILLFRGFDEFRIGTPKPRLIIGMKVLRQLHIYIAYGEQRIYFTSADAR